MGIGEACNFKKKMFKICHGRHFGMHTLPYILAHTFYFDHAQHWISSERHDSRLSHKHSESVEAFLDHLLTGVVISRSFRVLF